MGQTPSTTQNNIANHSQLSQQQASKPKPKIAGEQEIAKVLAENGGGKKAGGDKGKAHLTKASSLKNRSEIGRYIMSYGIEISPDANGEVEAVFCACQLGHSIILNQLRQFGIDIHARDKDGVTSLAVAALNDHLDIVDYLIKNGADINTQSEDGGTALMCACQNGHLEIVKRLVASGASLSIHTLTGLTCLHFACLNSQNEVVDFLTTDSRCKTTLDINATDEDMVTPLMCACFTGNIDIVQQLLQSNANTRLANLDGMTPLYYAIAGGHIHIVELLTQSVNARRTSRSSDGGSEGSNDDREYTADNIEQARDTAAEMGLRQIAEYLNSLL